MTSQCSTWTVDLVKLAGDRAIEVLLLESLFTSADTRPQICVFIGSCYSGIQILLDRSPLIAKRTPVGLLDRRHFHRWSHCFSVDGLRRELQWVGLTFPQHPGLSGGLRTLWT